MYPSLPTPRLILKPLQSETAAVDAVQVQSIFPYWEIVQHLNAAVPWPFPPDGVTTYYRETALPAIARGDEWHWTIRLKTHPEIIIGAISLMASNTPENPDNNNRGFWLAREHQNQGLITEAVIAANDYWFNVLGFPSLQSSKATANTASIRISKKTGMTRIATKISNYVTGQLPTELWSITKQEWQAWRTRMKP